jgi:hypothetical protein
MNYSEDPAMVRVDFFKPSGKFYTTEAVKWTGEYLAEKELSQDAFKKSLRDHFKGSGRLSDMIAVCMSPFHSYDYPIMIMPGDWLT